MLPLIVFAAVPLAMMLAVTLANALSGPRLDRGPEPSTRPLVSVLVPARNEQDSLPDCLAGLKAQDWDDLEILVLDDGSTDGTRAVIEAAAKSDSRVRFIEGAPLPAGWLGKPWACQQLAEAAKGDILLFTDADNRHAPDAVRRTVGWMGEHRLDVLSAFPQQITRGWADGLIVPTVDLLVYSLLPLWLTLRSSHPALAAANGQWLAMRWEAYNRTGGHAAHPADIVEDMALMRRAKHLRMRVLTVAGTGVVFGRMYGSPREVWHGFRKNLFGIAGGSRALLAVQLTLLLAATWLPYGLAKAAWFLPGLGRWRGPTLALVFANVLLRGVLHRRYNHPRALMLFHPLAMMLLAAIAVASPSAVQDGSLQWKGRAVRPTSVGGVALH